MQAFYFWGKKEITNFSLPVPHEIKNFLTKICKFALNHSDNLETSPIKMSAFRSGTSS
jgi:hypothetical protein